MSSMRRRSHPRRPADTGIEDMDCGKARPRPRFVLATATVVLLLLALLLVTQLRQSAPAHVLGWFTVETNAHSATLSQHDDSSFSSSSSFALHPRDHVFRDATTQTLHWRITTGYRRPDGVLKYVYLINDAFPGPTVEARSGDRLVVHVENALDGGEGLSMHWHGLWMRGNNEMDGAVGITQASIAPGEIFIYNFTIDAYQHGTFWYHSHDALQRADGLFGGLVVHQPVTQLPEYEPANEHLLLVGDWYHRSAQEALDFYMHPGAFGLETLPDSALINGAGAFACADAVPARPLDCKQILPSSLAVLQLDSKKRNVLRVVNVGAYAGFSLAVSDATLVPLAVDGGHQIDGRPCSSIGYMHPGERVDLLVMLSRHTNATASLNVTLDEQPFKYQNPALSVSHQFPVTWSGQPGDIEENRIADEEPFDIQAVRSMEQDKAMSSVADHTVVLYTLTQKLASLENEPHGFINHTVWSPQSPPLIELSRKEWNKHQFVPSFTFNESSPSWIDVVLNNLDEDSHPFHLHGHDFWVLSKYTSTSNWGSFNPFSGVDAPGGGYDLLRPVKKDTVYVPRRGYAVLRFRADNPGLWM